MKKKLLYSLACTLIITVSINLKAQTAPIPDLLHYNFTGGTSSLVTNFATNPPMGTNTGTLLGVISQTGALNCMNALVGSGLTSTSDYINTGWATNLAGAFSISFWSSNIQPSGTLYYIFGDVNAGGFRCFTNGVAGPNNWIVRGTGLTDILINGAATPSANMVTVTYDPTAGATSAYINGVYTNSVAYTSATITGTGPFKVGGYGSSTGLSPAGLMADFRIYSSVLTATQVAAIYASTSLTAISVSVTGNTSVCSAQTATLTASGANSYTWNTGATTNSVILTPTVNTTYTVMGMAGTCTNQTTQQVTISPSPTIAIAGPTAICTGNTVNLTASGASTYTWNTGANTTTIAATPTANVTYSAMGTGTNGCVGMNTKTVIVNSAPVISIAGSTAICIGGTVNLTASGASTYTWNTGANTAAIAATPTANITYTAMGTSSAGCNGMSTQAITVNSLPTVSASAATSSVCANGSTVALTGSPSGGVFTGSNVAGSVFTPGTNAGTFTQNYAFTNTVTGCSNTASTSITVLNCTGLNNITSLQGLLVSPNPSNGNFTIELANGLSKNVQVSDLTGRVILETTSIENTINVNISNLANGVYYVKVISNNANEILKVVKQ